MTKIEDTPEGKRLEEALLRLRAEGLLKRIADAEHPVTVSDADREQIVRVASVPRMEDREFLNSFDHIYEDDEEREEIEERERELRELKQHRDARRSRK